MPGFFLQFTELWCEFAKKLTHKYLAALLAKHTLTQNTLWWLSLPKSVSR
jgi:hypothetical protein